MISVSDLSYISSELCNNMDDEDIFYDIDDEQDGLDGYIVDDRFQKSVLLEKKQTVHFYIEDHLRWKEQRQ